MLIEFMKKIYLHLPRYGEKQQWQAAVGLQESYKGAAKKESATYLCFKTCPNTDNLIRQEEPPNILITINPRDIRMCRYDQICRAVSPFVGAYKINLVFMPSSERNYYAAVR